MLINKLFNLTPRDWVVINFHGVELNAYIEIPEYVPATLDTREEGGINDFKLLKLDYEGESLRKFFEASDMLEEIETCIIETYQLR